MDVAIVGGGIAGLVCATRLRIAGIESVLINSPIPGTANEFGGFAPFSGAKFSLFPAGSGLSELVGGQVVLRERYASVIGLFAASGIRKFRVDFEKHFGNENNLGDSIAFRKYHSILLTPTEINRLISFLAHSRPELPLLKLGAKRLEILDNGRFKIILADDRAITTRRLVVAAGRLGGSLLTEARVPQTERKGVDLGVRLEFSSPAPLAELRKYGPDAKFLGSRVRTFCLNSPGRIFHYPAQGFLVPGGVVAEGTVKECNVGILHRVSSKFAALGDLEARGVAHGLGHGPLSFIGDSRVFALNPALRSLLPDHVTESICEFTGSLINAGVLALPPTFRVHYPLIDWHWPVFSRDGTLETAVEGLYTVGDLSGHARGLLQAATMGWIAASEVVR